ncbi:tripartite tricarboxylate transporter permease [Salibacterium aidingense]|uniref:tripartite tricarboxylate transporter permease n=1 Tax=Salibacterium aidingense TaxID=384933 RepID=UPI003BC3626B
MVELSIIEQILTPGMILIIIMGTMIGIIFGAIPGLTGTIGVSLLLPISFAFEPQAGLLLLGGIYMGAMYGGSITAILINVPGAPEATFTAVEGHEMTKIGHSQRALYYSIFSSTFGGTIGVITLIFLTPLLVKIAVNFGPPEMFLLGLAGLTIISALAGGSEISKSIYATGFGILISTVGADMSSGVDRFTFGISSLKSGISLISIILAMFAISEMIINIGNKTGKITLAKQENISRFNIFKKMLTNWITVIRSTLIGVFLGVLPGVGGTTAAFVAYGNAKTASKTPKLFGKGSPEGIIANESANNAVVGSTLVPLLSLGIPGSGTAAIMLGALTIHGIIPGPDLFADRPDVAYTFMYGMLLTCIVMGVFGLIGIKWFSKVVNIGLEFIIPVTIVFSLLGAYGDRNSMFDVFITVLLAFIAVLMKQYGFPVAPLVLGVVLGPIIELQLRTSLVLAEAEGESILMFLMMRPLSVTLIVLVSILLYFMLKVNKKASSEIESSD